MDGAGDVQVLVLGSELQLSKALLGGLVAHTQFAGKAIDDPSLPARAVKQPTEACVPTAPTTWR